jgi:hypothetical protein
VDVGENSQNFEAVPVYPIFVFGLSEGCKYSATTSCRFFIKREICCSAAQISRISFSRICLSFLESSAGSLCPRTRQNFCNLSLQESVRFNCRRINAVRDATTLDQYKLFCKFFSSNKDLNSIFSFFYVPLYPRFMLLKFNSSPSSHRRETKIGFSCSKNNKLVARYLDAEFRPSPLLRL